MMDLRDVSGRDMSRPFMRSPLVSLMRDFVMAVIPPVIVLALHCLRMVIFPEMISMDMIAHFFGGFAIAWSAGILWRRWEKRGWVHAQAIVRDYAIVMTALFVGVAWEWWEFWMQVWTGYVFQPSMGDTMQDLFMDFSGGIVLIVLMRLRKFWR